MKPKPTGIKQFLTKERHLKLPYLDFYLRVPLLQIRADLFYERYERFTYEYIGLYVSFWKWDFTFRLYEPGEKRR